MGVREFRKGGDGTNMRVQEQGGKESEEDVGGGGSGEGYVCVCRGGKKGGCREVSSGYLGGREK